MAKNKKSKPTGKSRAKPKVRSETQMPDWRIIEDLMRQVGGLFVDSEADGPAAQAQDILYQAFEAPPARQVKLARKALEIWPDCADGYALLAEHAKTLPAAIELYEQAVAAGKRALGTDFEQMAGRFWGFIETRPYMRARLALAHCLHAAGRWDEAAEHYREMLQLNPNDNQGVREVLAACLLELGQNDELAELLARYREDGSAAWAYASVLLAYRNEGDSETAGRLLAAARKTNKHVPAYLLGDKLLPRQLPDYVGRGDENEAIAYAADFLPAWKSTPGAISWLRAKVAAAKSRKKPAKSRMLPALPTVADDALRSVPLIADEVWQADIRRLPSWVQESGRLIRPFVIFVTDATHDLVMGHELSMDRPPPETLWQTVAAAIVNPVVGQPHRPSMVEVCAAEGFAELQARLKAIDVRCVARDDLAHIDHVAEQFSQDNQQDDQMMALVDAAGVEPRALAGFYEAAAAFYRYAPWRHVAGDTVIELTCPDLSAKPWNAVVMGQSGLELGLALYDNPKVLRSILHNDLSPEEHAGRTSAISVSFGEEFELPIRDLDAIERWGWNVAGPEAYPAVMRIKPGHRFVAVEPRELELAEVALRTIPQFLAEPREGNLEATTALGVHSVHLRCTE